MSVLIKNFGNDTECFNLEEFKKALIEKYLGKEISIVYPLESGINTTVFVKVQDDYTLIDSYDDKVIEHSSFGLT